MWSILSWHDQISRGANLNYLAFSYFYQQIRHFLHTFSRWRSSSRNTSLPSGKKLLIHTNVVLTWPLQFVVWSCPANVSTNKQTWILSQTLQGLNVGLWILPNKYRNSCPFSCQDYVILSKSMGFNVILPKLNSICTLNNLFYTHICLTHLNNFLKQNKKATGSEFTAYCLCS